MHNNEDIKLYGYRWVVFGVFFVLNIVMQLHGFTFGSLTGNAAKFYGVKDIQIDLSSIIFMVMMVILSVPASLVINRFGIRIGVGIGAVILGGGGLIKGIFASNYIIVLASQIGVSIAQPFIVVACTRVSAVWFPIHERATITGLLFLAQFLGMFISLGVTPFIVSMYAITGMMMIYGVVSLVAAIFYLIFIREKPPTPPCTEGQEFRLSSSEGLKRIFSSPNMYILMIVFFIGLGVFNSVATCIEQIFRHRGYTMNEAGMLGMLLIVGGIIGSFFWSYLSDKRLKRKVFILICWSLIPLCLTGIALLTNQIFSEIASFGLGFTLLGVGPLGFQYAAEITYPVPESLSSGVLQLVGQSSGIFFVLGMNAFGDYNQESVFIFIFLTLICLLLSLKLQESTLIQTDQWGRR